VKLPLTIKLLQFTHTQNLLLSILATLPISPHFGETFLQKDYIRCQSKMQAFPIIFFSFSFFTNFVGFLTNKKAFISAFSEEILFQNISF